MSRRIRRIKMSLYETMREELTIAMKIKHKEKLSAYRVILGEFPRLNLKAGETVSDEQIISILKRLQKGEKTILEHKEETTSVFLEVVELYLPQMMTEEEIQKYINKNIDISMFRSPMQAMGPIMKALTGKADGTDVKAILEKMND